MKKTKLLPQKDKLIFQLWKTILILLCPVTYIIHVIFVRVYVCVVVKNLSFFFVSKSFLVFDTMVIAPTIIKEVKKISTKEKFESTDM